MSRLVTLSKRLAAKLARVDPDQRRRTVIAALTAAINAYPVHDDLMGQVLEAIQNGNMIPDSVSQQIDEMREQYDAQYFEAQNIGGGATPESLRLFSAARIMSALGFATRDLNAPGSSEAIYEAACATNNPKALAKYLIGQLE